MVYFWIYHSLNRGSAITNRKIAKNRSWKKIEEENSKFFRNFVAVSDLAVPIIATPSIDPLNNLATLKWHYNLNQTFLVEILRFPLSLWIRFKRHDSGFVFKKVGSFNHSQKNKRFYNKIWNAVNIIVMAEILLCTCGCTGSPYPWNSNTVVPLCGKK